MIDRNKMTNMYCRRLEQFLDSECAEYGLVYNFQLDEFTERFIVEIKNPNTGKSKLLNFRFNAESELEIYMGHVFSMLTIPFSKVEDSFYTVDELRPSVKHFWMMASSLIFD